MAPDYEHLTLMQKVEVFEHALEHTQGDDLAKILWVKSPSSEVWFDRRTNYTRSLAVMSMVGYVLGLGDRWVRITDFQRGKKCEIVCIKVKSPRIVNMTLVTLVISHLMSSQGLCSMYTKKKVTP